MKKAPWRRRFQSLSPESILPVMELLHDRDRNVREMAGFHRELDPEEVRLLEPIGIRPQASDDGRFVPRSSR